MPIILANNLSFQLDTGEWLFKDITFNLSTRLTGLVGRNGAGKSTLLKVICQQTPATSGEAKIGPSVKMGYFSQFSFDVLN